MEEITARVDRHFKFSKTEATQLLLTAVVAAFGLTLSPGWGFFNITEGTGLVAYFFNIIIVFFLMLFALFFHFSVQKIVALSLGYTGEYTYWKNGFLISLFLSFVSVGFFPLFFTGSMSFKIEKKLRMGRFRYGVMQKDVGVISFAGPLFSLLLAAFLGIFYVSAGGKLLFALIVANLLCAIYSLIPIPVFEGVRVFKGGTSGLYLFIASRWFYVVSISFVLAYSMLVLIAQWFSIIIAAIIGIFAGVMYYSSYEKL